MKFNEVTQDEVKLLKPDQLVDLLDILISCEIAKTYQSGEVGHVSVPRPITIKDGGEDAKVILDIPANDNRLDNSHWIRTKYTMFQCKAQKMDDKASYKEVIREKSKPKALKIQVQQCVDVDGEYILFTTDSFSDASAESRAKEIKKAFADCKVSNADDRKVRIIDANQIVRWANNFIQAVIFIQGCRGIGRLGEFLTWEEWYTAFLIQKKYEFQETELLKNHKVKLYDDLENEKVLRVVGHKGLGKTRFVLEAFNPKSSNPNVSNLSKMLVYLDLALADPRALSAFLVNHSQMEGIIIVDNCTDEWHDGYLPLVKMGNLKMITINDSWLNSKPNTIVIDRKMQKDVVKMIFNNCFNGLSEVEVDQFVRVSEGFPEMVPFIDNIIQNQDTQILYSTIPGDFITKFLFADKKNDAEYELFKACSVFSEFSFYDDKIEDLLSDQEKAKIKQQNKLIFQQITKQPIDEARFYQFCVKYRDKRNLLEKKGRNYSVIPEPIAVNLAAEWWEETPFEFVKNLNKDLDEVGLLVPMIDRLRLLDQSEKAKLIVSKAWGPNGPFSTAEVLNSELGSRLFRSVVEVNPQPTVEALDYAIGEWTIDELRTNFKTGRRNIVWALEKLVFRKETFNLAAKMMCKLAAGENETYGNNATGQFMQLFHIYLAGTEADFEDRLEVIKWGLEQEDEQIKAVSITACGHALKSHGFHRTIGAEDQGLVMRLKEYKPETWDQIYDYWKQVIFLLVDTAEKNAHLIGIIKVQISAAIRSMFGSGQSKVIVDTIKRIVAIDPSLWSEAIDDLKKARQFEDLDEKEKELVDELIRFLTPEEIGDRLQFLVIKPEWEYSRDLNVDSTQKKAEDFGLEVTERKLDIIPYLQNLLTGEQRQTYFFGVKLASHENIHKIIDETIQCLDKVPEKQQNPALLAGILASVSLSEQRRVIGKLLENDHLNRHVFYLIRLIKPNISEIEQLFDLVDNGKTAIRNFEGFRYGRALDHLTEEEVLGLFEKIASYGVDGASTAFAIASQHCFQDEARWNILKDFIRSIVMKYSIFIDLINARSQDEYLWSMQVIKLLEEQDDRELAQTVSEQIIIGAGQQDFSVHDSYLVDVVNLLCTNYFNIFWKTLKDVLLENSIRYFKLKSLLGSHNGSGESSGVLFIGDHDVIIDWCKHNSPKAAYRIAYMMPIYGKDGWSDFAMKMIDEFGNDGKVLDEIGANMGSFSMVGSSENYYNRIIEMAKKLYKHKYPNVRKWAKSCVQYHDKLIRREKLDDEQRS